MSQRIEEQEVAEGEIQSPRCPDALKNQDSNATRTKSNRHVLLESVGLEEAAVTLVDANDITECNSATFKVHNWDQAMEYLNTKIKEDNDARNWLIVGGRHLGLWPMSTDSLKGLVNTLFESKGRQQDLSPGMQRYLEHLKDPHKSHRLQNRTIVKDFLTDKNLKENMKSSMSAELSNIGTAEISNRVMRALRRLKARRGGRRFCECTEFKVKVTFFIFFVVICNAYALEVILVMYPQAVQTLGWPIYFARACGFGISILTALMFFSMSKSFLKIMAKCMNGTVLLDAHVELHVFMGELMVAWSVIHTIGHVVATVPSVMALPEEKINDLLGCAHPTEHHGYLGVRMDGLLWPNCPLQKNNNWRFLDYLFRTMPGLTGVLLWILLAVTAITAEASYRKKHFDHFYYVHNFMVFAWPVLLFFHGSQGWVGIGFPLVVFCSSLPLLFYIFDRVTRMVRACQYAEIVDYVVRPGPHGGPKGALTFIKLSRPVMWWGYEPGAYGHLNMPQYAPLQWHPFTICSGRTSETVDFVVAAIGDWTEELAKRCLEADTEGSKGLPRILLDGPHHAPMTNALGEEVLIAIGAGVGVTPLLSLMSSVVALVDDNWNQASIASAKPLRLKEVHFYWMTRSADEFLLAKKQITDIVCKGHVRNMVFLHLHVTGSAPPKDSPSFLFREAAHRQSERDRKAFQEVLKEANTSADIVNGPNTPWAWVNGSNIDLLWSGELISHEESTETTKEMKNLSLPEWAIKAHNKSHCKSRAFSSTSLQDGQAVPRSSSSGDVERPRTFTLVLRHLFHRGSSRGHSQQHIDADNTHMLPIYIGRPEFSVELATIGRSRPDSDIGVYVCGNDAVVKNLRIACGLCEAMAIQEGKSQEYKLHFERFG